MATWKEGNERARAALKLAERRSGTNATSFAMLLRATPQTTYVGWFKGDTAVPAWALIAAAEVVGATVSDLLLADDPDILARISALDAGWTSWRALEGRHRSGDWSAAQAG